MSSLRLPDINQRRSLSSSEVTTSSINLSMQISKSSSKSAIGMKHKDHKLTLPYITTNYKSNSIPVNTNNSSSTSSAPIKPKLKKRNAPFIIIRYEFDNLPDEILIQIASFCKVGDVARLARTNSKYLKLLLNQTARELPKLKEMLEKKRKLKNDMLKVNPQFLKQQEKQYKPDEQRHFRVIQNLIWKPLVLYYFPNFVKKLKVSNWLHVFRRRVENIHKCCLPIKRKGVYKFIENCPKIYKCPMTIEMLKKYCNVEDFCNSIQFYEDDSGKYCEECKRCVVETTSSLIGERCAEKGLNFCLHTQFITYYAQWKD